MKPLPHPLRCMLFDLDGTLVDSARDMYDALVALCAERGVASPPFGTVRETVSRGARAVLRCAFGEQGEPALDAVLPRFLELYVATGMVNTHAFDGVDELLRALDARGIRWGVVTNKAGALAELVLRHLHDADRMVVLVAGDTLPQRKPDPAPVLHACAIAGVAPAHTAFVGDDPRDVEAGRAAGAYTVAAAWGYLDGAAPAAWGADAVADTPRRIVAWLGSA